MVIPKPIKNEPEAKFISRCMTNPTMKQEYPDQKQRTAVCVDSWKKNTESVNIIEASTNSKSSKIIDYDYQINLGQEYEKSIITPKIIGKLDSLIILTNKKCAVSIRFKHLPNIIIFNDMAFEGMKYLSIRSQTVTFDHKLLLSGFAKYILNNAVEITVSGSSNTNVGITLRCINA